MSNDEEDMGFGDFQTAIFSQLKDKVREKLDTERRNISNSLFYTNKSSNIEDENNTEDEDITK
jgi:hypothetical protein